IGYALALMNSYRLRSVHQAYPSARRASPLLRAFGALFHGGRRLGGARLAGVQSVIAYGIVLWAQTQAPLAEVAAIRETSVVFAALIGMMLFSERFGGRRVAAAVLVAAGVVVISI